MNKGFTLVELIAVIVILALLVIITTPAYDNVSKNIKERNYESKKSTIKAQTLDYVEKYLKNEAYDPARGTTAASQTLCFTPTFLIRNGIITSDDEEKEYIKNELDDETYGPDGDTPLANNVYIKIMYDLENLKLKAIILGEQFDKSNENTKFEKYNCNKTY